MDNQDLLFMTRVLELAREALCDGEVPVGALVVCDGKICGEGRNRREKNNSVLGHAEIEALDVACRTLGSWRLQNCTLYVNLEPCPMCAGALSQARVGRIVCSVPDPSCGALGGLFRLQDRLQGWNPVCECGLMAEESRALLDSFFKNLRRDTGSKRLPRDFYSRPADVVAREMLGKFLCVKNKANGEVTGLEISETEAYFGFSDSASHAYHGITDRNRPMFDKGGTVYVYLCYGIHNMLNIVTGEKGTAEAVLIRGVRGAEGPGKLSKVMGIERSMNGADCVLSDIIWLEDRGCGAPAFTAGPRIGIDSALPEDREKLLRFTLD